MMSTILLTLFPLSSLALNIEPPLEQQKQFIKQIKQMDEIIRQHPTISDLQTEFQNYKLSILPNRSILSSQDCHTYFSPLHSAWLSTIHNKIELYSRMMSRANDCAESHMANTYTKLVSIQSYLREIDGENCQK